MKILTAKNELAAFGARERIVQDCRKVTRIAQSMAAKAKREGWTKEEFAGKLQKRLKKYLNPPVLRGRVPTPPSTPARPELLDAAGKPVETARPVPLEVVR